MCIAVTFRAVADLGFRPNPAFGWTKYTIETSTDDRLDGTLLPGWRTKETASATEGYSTESLMAPNVQRINDPEVHVCI